MSKNKEIDPKLLFVTLWKERFLISFFCILSMLVFFLYSINTKADFTVKFAIKDPENRIFEPYNTVFYSKENEIFRTNINNHNVKQIGKSYLKNQFVLTFNQNIKSVNYFRDFLKQHNNYDKFYKINHTELENYFKRSRFLKNNNKENDNDLLEYNFIFPEDFPGDIFFKDYIQFTKNKTMIEFEIEIKETITNSINNDKKLLRNLKNIDLTAVADSQKYYNFNEYLLSKNINEVSTQIEQNTLLMQDLSLKKFEYNPFFDDIFKSTPALKYSKFLYSLSGLLFGFFLSLIFVYFKSLKIN
jgi:hypothetical protein